MSSLNDDALEAVAPVIAALEQLRVAFYIGGSLASSAFGIARSTIDVDVVAELVPEHAPRLVKLLGDQYYADEEAIRQAAQRRTSFNVIYLPNTYKIDIFVPKNRRWDDRALDRVRRARLDENDPSTELPFASPEDVILNKLEWYRAGGETSERQWLDVLNVMKVQGARLENDYLDRWAGELGVADLLARARNQTQGFSD